MDSRIKDLNCRWTTTIEQMNNRRNNVFFNYNGKEYTALQMSKEFNINPITFRDRVYRGWSIEDAVSTPINIMTYKGNL